MHICGPPAEIDHNVCFIRAKFHLDTITRGPGFLSFFGLNITRHEDNTISVNSTDKFMQIETFLLWHVCRHQQGDAFNSIEASSFASVNSAIGWTGATPSLLCSEFASRFQQRASKAIVHDLVAQAGTIRKLKKLGTSSLFNRATDAKWYDISVLVFADAARSVDYGQLCYICGAPIGDLDETGILHVLSWSSRKSRRTVKSSGSAESLACSESIDEGKALFEALCYLLDKTVPFVMAVDSKDLFNALSNQGNASDKSILADVNVVRYEFETRKIFQMVWIHRKLNLADVGTEQDYPILDAFRLWTVSGQLPFKFTDMESRTLNRMLG